ncbi:MAG TPA: patatin-like phospholipase family protein [Solirubrobacteraceae bacterium]|nr:patatin-like phospholipase family protein [Solirubrobacteraceae bacterium]
MLARAPMFAGLTAEELEAVAQRARSKAFAPGKELCRAGQAGESCWVITAGLVDVYGAGDSVAAGEIVARRRKGSTVGEAAVILSEPHAETVIASIPTSTLELRAEDVHGLIERFPAITLNVLRTLRGHLTHARERARVDAQQGETVALVFGPSLRGIAGPVIAAARSATPRPVSSLTRDFSFAGAVTAAGDLASSHATVLLPTELDAQTVATLRREADRVVALLATANEVAELDGLEASDRPSVELVLVGQEAARAARGLASADAVRVLRTFEPERGLRLGSADLGWVGRHLTRAKLGLALGAGGAKGYAHVGVLGVLEDAGYVVDCVAGSSIGAIVGSYHALGSSAAEIDRTLRTAFDAESVAEIFKINLAGRATGLELMTRLMRETTGDQTFADTKIPLTIMSVDLVRRAPAPLREGVLWEALLAATALAGMFPPFERDGQRLVDGLALVPVPTEAVVEDGADVTVAVNLMSPHTLPRWPGGPVPEPPPERRRRGVLDDLLEVMDLSQLAQSTRHAELADVPISPLFGPGEWRDFHLADQFMAAGRAEAERALPMLRSLVLPTSDQSPEKGDGVERSDALRL